MRGKAARNLWGKEDSPGQNAKTVAAERRTRAAAARNKTAEASQEAEAEQQTITSKKGFLAGLVNDVFYIEKTIPDTFPEENSVPLLPKNTKKKAAPPTEGSGPFVEAVSKARKPPAQKTRRTMARTAPMLKPVSAKGERKSQSEAAPLEATQSGVEIEPKRARRALSPALRKTLLVTTLLLSLAMLLWVYTFTGVLNIKNIDISGNSRLDADYLRGLSGITAEDHLFKMNVGAVKQALLSEPYVAEAHISRRFPNTVAIEIIERKPAGIISQNAKYHLVDEEGRVLESLDKKPPGLLEIQGLDLKLLFPGQQINNESFAVIAILLQSMPDQLKSITASIGYKQEEGLYLQAKGTEVIYGQATDLSRKSEIALLALNDLVAQYHAVDYIDVSYPEHPVIKPAD